MSDHKQEEVEVSSETELNFGRRLDASLDGDTASVSHEGLTVGDSDGTVSEGVGNLAFGDGLQAADEDGRVRVDAPLTVEQVADAANDRLMYSQRGIRLYVGADGNDDNNGRTPSKPIASLQEAFYRLPYFTQHQVDIIVLTNEDGPATADEGTVRLPFCAKNSRAQETQAGSGPSFAVRAQGDDPGNHIIQGDSYEMGIFGDHPSAILTRNLRLKGTVRCLDGSMRLADCEIFPDSGPAIEAASGIIHMRSCAIKAPEVVGRSPGSHVDFNQTTGRADTFVSGEGPGGTLVTINDNRLDYDSLLGDETHPTTVIEEDTLLHPKPA